ncbi:MAG: riboflavin biosynthesis protein RibF, partial [Cytophagales bacterium]|nr:riboflavin biosynthesis protein RibF [Cytophagales bacterium]
VDLTHAMSTPVLKPMGPSSSPPLKKKLEALLPLGLDFVVKIAFTPAFAQMSSDDFIRQVLVEQIGTYKLVIGHDHHFGKNREGSFQYLQENQTSLGFEVEEIAQQTLQDIGISSSRIRQCLDEGLVEEAARYLGRPYLLSGRVVQGDRLGRQLGYPTANLEIAFRHKLIPADGVYAVRALVEGTWHQGMFYIGKRPSIHGATRRTLEVNIFDFEKDIYAREIQVEMVARLRGDQVFDSLDELRNQLGKDKQAALNKLYAS